MMSLISRAAIVCLVTSVSLQAADPPALDVLTENSADQWVPDADWSTAAVYNDATRFKVGAQSVRLETPGGNDTWMSCPVARDASWDFSCVGAVRFWVYAENANPGFENCSPWIRLATNAGLWSWWEYRTSQEILNSAIGHWVEVVIPVDGDSTWVRTQVNTPDRANIDFIEIHADTLGSGFKLWIDGLTCDTLPPNPLGLTAAAGDSVVTLAWNPYAPRPGFQCFRIYRSNSAFSAVTGLTPIATITDQQATTYADTQAVNGTSYYYAITAVINGVEETIVTCIGPRIPAARADLSLTPFYSTVHLQWSFPPMPDIAAYEVYRRPAAGVFPTTPTRRLLVRNSMTDYDLIPGATYVYKVRAVDGAGNVVADFGNETATTLGADPGIVSTHKNFDVLFVFYTGGYSSQDISRTVKGFNTALEFYWRTTRCRMNMDPTWLLIDAPLPQKDADLYTASVQNQLRARGLQDDQYDLVYLVAHGLPGCYGGYLVFGLTCGAVGTECGIPYPGMDPSIDYNMVWGYAHEMHHALELMQNLTPVVPEILGDHFPWNYPDVLGPTGWHMDWNMHFDGIAQTNRQYGNSWMEFPEPHRAYIECIDADHDGLPDNDARVPADEARFGSDPALADTDDDGLDDLSEYSACNFRGADPLNPDTDHDGRPDGQDRHPLYATADFIPAFAVAPVIDGRVEPSWQSLATGYYFTQNTNSFSLTTYVGWDANNLYFAFKSTRRLRFMISIDGSGQDGRFESPVRHKDGATDTYNPDNKQNHYGDSWADGNYLYACYGGSQVNVNGGSVVNGSQVASQMSKEGYCTEVKIPRVLPKGSAYTWYPPDAPVVDGLTLEDGHIIGLNVTFSNLENSSSDEFSGTWTCLFETYSLVDFTLRHRPTGDLDGDSDVDQADFGLFQACFSGPGVRQAAATCINAHMDGDEDVDADDLELFQGCISGPSVPADPMCASRGP